ncbi:MAG: 2-nitropropane dioxygenase [Burkholderiales bacterium PBB3]|nr:MAG: 2-nitropropane dioxygenase [Burkholderiales bacterium PBB3]
MSKPVYLSTTKRLPFALDLPIIQAPMAGVQGSAMAIAVSNAGGLGSIPCAMLTPDALRSELQALQSGTTRPYNVNFFCHSPPEPDAARMQAWMAALKPYHHALGIDPSTISTGPGRVPFDATAAALLAEFRPAVVSFHFGLPTPALLAAAKAWGATVLSSATTLAEAVRLEEQGVDVIIAQGLEAGGHRGLFLSDDLGTQIDVRTLLRQIVAKVQCPVIAAGGLRHAADVQEMLDLGAAAAQVGSAYLLCPESTASAVHRAALQSPAAKDTALTNLFTGRPARGIVNRLMRELGPMSAAAPAFPLATGGIAPLRAKAEAAGLGDFSPLWAGQNAWAARPMGAAELTLNLAGRL